jgi:predicted nucleic acid binding AN1-type Zn finger protein
LDECITTIFREMITVKRPKMAHSYIMIFFFLFHAFFLSLPVSSFTLSLLAVTHLNLENCSFCPHTETFRRAVELWKTVGQKMFTEVVRNGHTDVNSRALLLQSVTESVSLQVEFIGPKCPGVKQCIQCQSCGLKEYSMKSCRLCGLVVSVADYKHRGPGFDSRALLRIFLRELGLERGPLSLVIG